ncbi:hypothetical protein PMAYCL1PPCAC_23464, partial [Pristionchus mayeri]
MFIHVRMAYSGMVRIQNNPDGSLSPPSPISAQSTRLPALDCHPGLEGGIVALVGERRTRSDPRRGIGRVKSTAAAASDRALLSHDDVVSIESTEVLESLALVLPRGRIHSVLAQRIIRIPRGKDGGDDESEEDDSLHWKEEEWRRIG